MINRVSLRQTGRLLVTIAALTGMLACQPKATPTPAISAQQTLDTAAEQIGVRLTVLSNLDVEDCPAASAQCYLAQLDLTLPAAMPADWRIYFSHISPIGWHDSELFELQHINGDLHKITVKTGQQVNAGQYRILFKGPNWLVSESGLFPNFILEAPGLSPQVISATREVKRDGDPLARAAHVAAFETPQQRKRNPDDNMPLVDATWRFQQQAALQTLPLSASPRVLPSVQKSDWQSERRTLTNGISLPADSRNQATLSHFLTWFGLPLQNNGEAVLFTLDSTLGDEAYALTIQHDSIEIRAATEQGRFYALMTLAQLYRSSDTSLPIGSISDAPRYSLRGLHLDVARNFRSVAFVQRLLDVMAAVKLNTLHLHLADDEGWRLQIQDLPELTEVGGKRCLDLTEEHCLLPQLGAGVDPTSQVNGYYSREDYIGLLRYAAQRHIEVIPALDMPGHSRAAIVAMQARYRKLMQAEQSDAANQYYLSEPQDQSHYSSIQHYHDNTLNPCIDSTYAFVNKVLDEVQILHKEAGVPLTRYHIGADETAGAWQDSPACQALIARQPELTEAKQLSAYFVEKVANMVSQRGMIPGAWSDGLSHANPRALPRPIQSNVWDTLFWGGSARTHDMANQGMQVVLSFPDMLYLDFPYESDPKEPGYYWGSRATDSEQIFQFMPANLPAHAEIWPDRMGNPYADKDPTPLKKPENIIGLQAQLWSETVRSDERAEYMLYPRLFSVAERAWHMAPWEQAYQAGRAYSAQTRHMDDTRIALRNADWWQFSAQLSNRWLPMLSEHQIAYRTPLPGAQVNDGRLYMTLPFAGLVAEYQLGDSGWQTYLAPLDVGNRAVRVRARVPGTDHTSRVQQVQ